MALEKCWWKSPWSWCWRGTDTDGGEFQHRCAQCKQGSPKCHDLMTCWEYCACGWCLMKLSGFLCYFCHIQISTELKDEAVGPKFLRILKKRERKEEEDERNRWERSTHVTYATGPTPHSTPTLSGTPHSHMLAFQSHDSWIFSFF